MPRFSVLMPTHNRADVVAFAIRSVLDQTEADFELLIVGDGCTDNTAAVVASFADARIRWFDLPKAPNFGYANRNVALHEARGELIAYAAHDDLLLPDHLARLGTSMAARGSDWIYSRPLWVSTDGVIVPFAVNLELADERRFFLERANSIPMGCVVHRANCVERYGYWPEDVKEFGDWHYWRRIVASAPLAYDPVPTMLHFTANWKRSRHGHPIARALLNVADRSEWWPRSIKVAVNKGEPEQAVFSRLLSDRGLEWSTQLRRDVDVVVNRMAWEMTSALVRTLEEQGRPAPLRR
jgi:glycosyltransferase involved in cell wall biosynthesis